MPFHLFLKKTLTQFFVINLDVLKKYLDFNFQIIGFQKSYWHRISESSYFEKVWEKLLF